MVAWTAFEPRGFQNNAFQIAGGPMSFPQGWAAAEWVILFCMLMAWSVI